MPGFVASLFLQFVLFHYLWGFHWFYLGILRKVKFLVLQLSGEMSEVVIHIVFLLILMQIYNYK